MVRIEPLHEVPRDADRLARVLDGGWPAFISADTTAEERLTRIRRHFADLELLAIDAPRYVGAGWAVPIQWDGEVSGLPSGYTDSLARALATVEGEDTANTLVVCAAQVDPAERGRGIAPALLEGFKSVARARGYPRLVLPLRPTAKYRYPLTPIEEYASWTRSDGSPFDPWLRTHVRMGARIIAFAPRSQAMTGSVADWERWTGMALPSPGDYVIPEGLSVLRIDDAGVGHYVEPNIWLEHPLSPANGLG